MAQRISGYERQPNETYLTPSWVVDALAEHVALKGCMIWEPCAASGQMAAALEAYTGRGVWRSDLVPDPDARVASRTHAIDFLTTRAPGSTDAIVTNPPWGTGGRLAVAFIEHALNLMRTSNVSLIAYLLAVDFDSAGGRTALFRDCPEFAMTIRLLKRIKWFDGPSGPSTNHAWFVWQRPALNVPHGPVTRYAPTELLEAPTPSLLLADL